MALKLPPYPAEYIQVNFIGEETQVRNYIYFLNFV